VRSSTRPPTLDGGRWPDFKEVSYYHRGDAPAGLSNPCTKTPRSGLPPPPPDRPAPPPRGWVPPVVASHLDFPPPPPFGNLISFCLLFCPPPHRDGRQRVGDRCFRGTRDRWFPEIGLCALTHVRCPIFWLGSLWIRFLPRV